MPHKRKRRSKQSRSGAWTWSIRNCTQTGRIFKDPRSTRTAIVHGVQNQSDRLNDIAHAQPDGQVREAVKTSDFGLLGLPAHPFDSECTKRGQFRDRKLVHEAWGWAPRTTTHTATTTATVTATGTATTATAAAITTGATRTRGRRTLSWAHEHTSRRHTTCHTNTRKHRTARTRDDT